MGKVVEKKKGRPSLLDLQKRRIQERNENQHAIPTLPRRNSQRNSTAADSSPERIPGENGYDEEMSSHRGRREKKLKLVVKLLNSSSGDQGGSDSEGQEKRKIAANGDGSVGAEIEKVENLFKSASTDQGMQLDSKESSPLPDKRLLLSVLDRIQKKDTYGVFSEPVDPEELPDYHEIIKHPMDFGTVRKKLDSGAYAISEQIESDVFLICSNAMQYNAPETVYFRQARAIQELARKSFENLRQDSEGNIAAPEPKRRGRPPTKDLKRPPPLDRFASSDATLATGGDNAVSGNYDLRKAQFHVDKLGLVNSSRRPRANDVYVNCVTHYRYDQNDANGGSLSKSSPMKWGKTQAITDEEDRRSTYNQFDVHEPSVLTTFSREQKQLMTVGLHSDQGYARSLARFAADLSPSAWKITSNRIEKSLPSGVEFGPGWVGENDLLPPCLHPSSTLDAKPLSLWPFSIPGNTTLPEVKNHIIDTREKVEAQYPKASQPFLREEEEAVEGSGLIMLRPQVHPNTIQQPRSNGFNSSSSSNNIASHIGKLIEVGARPPSLNFHGHLNPSSNKEDCKFLHLNVRFNSPTSPTSAARAESAQPDLALQL